MSFSVLVTDYVWPSIEPEKAVLAEIGAELVVAPDASEDTWQGWQKTWTAF